MFRRVTLWRGEINLIGQLFLVGSPGNLLGSVSSFKNYRMGGTPHHHITISYSAKVCMLLIKTKQLDLLLYRKNVSDAIVYLGEYGWGQIDEHCWSSMTSQLIIQCCRGWTNCPTCRVQQCVIMCVEQC